MIQQFLISLLFVLLGVLTMIGYDWNKVKKEGGEFNIQGGLPWYGLSLLIGGVLAYFIKYEIVQQGLLYMAAIVFVHIFRGIGKITK